MTDSANRRISALARQLSPTDSPMVIAMKALTLAGGAVVGATMAQKIELFPNPFARFFGDWPTRKTRSSATETETTRLSPEECMHHNVTNFGDIQKSQIDVSFGHNAVCEARMDMEHFQHLHVVGKGPDSLSAGEKEEHERLKRRLEELECDLEAHPPRIMHDGCLRRVTERNGAVYYFEKNFYTSRTKKSKM